MNCRGKLSPDSNVLPVRELETAQELSDKLQMAVKKSGLISDLYVVTSHR